MIGRTWLSVVPLPLLDAVTHPRPVIGTVDDERAKAIGDGGCTAKRMQMVAASATDASSKGNPE